ncbi:MAG: HlyC/CorC family transporter [Deltaproteobacteria bacterium]|nr:HlyC/CorC family transporter [Deltaproteobacteria bacterium]RLB36412.1 MAG: HlyC/CorC family transporter [Deltaproteobacteria bacterium]
MNIFSNTRGKKVSLEDSSDQGIIRRIKTLLGKRAHPGNSVDLAEEIHDLMDEGQAKGLVSDEETVMVQGVLDLKETTVHSVMIPRTEISSAPLHATLGEVIQLVTECGHTRIPMHRENIDEIVGILHAKDLLKLWGQEPGAQIPGEILRPPLFVPEKQKLSDLLRTLKEKKTHLAVVTDEYGGTAGIVTIEDILEEIVGDIMDEHDNEAPLITVLEDEAVLVDARLEVERLEDHLRISLPRGDFESVGGFIIHLLGRIPEPGETIPYDSFHFTIKNADQRKIDKILITRREGSPEEESG